ncbi:hypothetical protein WICPIJ_008784 [Wickerhamomyces pijperi]|uniref:Uncharacterized protein n=1 Tax=Wickerhamomyces pijperi TaxID=599730 RepID=A0A9P8THK3_WICPI|nr:hypothetical protein WICPIJ_008784 [Wickerhamomyces pijperi]
MDSLLVKTLPTDWIEASSPASSSVCSPVYVLWSDAPSSINRVSSSGTLTVVCSSEDVEFHALSFGVIPKTVFLIKSPTSTKIGLNQRFQELESRVRPREIPTNHRANNRTSLEDQRHSGERQSLMFPLCGNFTNNSSDNCDIPVQKSHQPSSEEGPVIVLREPKHQ